MSHDPDRKSRLTLAIEVLLLGLLAYLPLALGGVRPLSHVVLVAVAAAIALCLAVRCLVCRELEVVWSWAYVPAALFLGLVWFQQLPIGMDLLRGIARGNAEVWSELAGELRGVGSDPEAASISLYPWATRASFRLLLSAAVVLLAAINLFRGAAALRRLLLGVSVIGLAVVALALVQDLSGATAVYWTYEPKGWAHIPHDLKVLGGPFVHRGHFCEFTSLSMGAAAALLMIRALDRRPGEQLRLRQAWSLPDLDRGLWGFLILAIVAIGLTTSRNGLLSMLLGATLMGASVHATRFVGGIGWPFLGLMLAGFIGLLLLGIDPLYERMATLAEPGDAYSGRYELVRDAVAMFGRFPTFGAGQGTFEMVFPMFDQSMRPGTAAHAENQYVELLAETGLVGTVLVGLFAACLLRAWTRLAFPPAGASRPSRAAAFGLGFGLLALAVNSTTDFGFLLPSIMTLCAVFAGVLLGRAATRSSSAPLARLSLSLACLVAAGLLILQLPSALAATQANDQWESAADLQESVDGLSPGEKVEHYGRLLSHVEQAAALQPGKIEYGYWSVLHRWSRAYSDEEAVQSAQEGMTLTPSDALAAAARVAQSRLAELRHLAPTFGPLWSVAGQLGVRWIGDESAAEWIHLGLDLAPHHPATGVASAAQLLREGRDEEARQAFSRAIKVGASATGILDTLMLYVHRPDVALEIARSELALMVHLERLLERHPEMGGDLPLLEQEIVTMLEEACASPDPLPWMLKRLADHRVLEGRDPDAAGLYRRYLNLVPSSPHRYDLAKALIRMGEVPEARMHLQDLLRVHPHHTGGEDLLEELLER